MSSVKFTHLHTHTPEGSLLDGFMQIDKAIKKITAAGMDSLAVSDHGTMAAHYKFNEAAKKAGIHAVFGTEAYITFNKKFTKADFDKVEFETDEEGNYQFAFMLKEEQEGKWMPISAFPTKKIQNEIEKKAKATFYPKLFEDSFEDKSLIPTKKMAFNKGVKALVESYINQGYELCVRGDTSQRDFFSWFPKSGHLLLLAKNNEGYQNMITLNNLANLEGFYMKPRIDYGDIKQYGKGIICTSACRGSVPNQLLLKGYRDEAIKEIKRYVDAFDEVYLELQPSRDPEQLFVNEELIKISEELNLPLVVTCDAHMVDKEEEELHKTMTNIGHGSSSYEADESDISAYDTAYLMLPEEILSYGIPEVALTNAYELAHKCQVDYLDNKDVKYPEYKVPEGETFDSYLRELSHQGLLDLLLKKDYIDNYEEYINRLEYELSVIKDKKLSAYFIIVWDYINWAKSNGIYVGPGRGCTTKNTKLYAENDIKYINEIQVGDYVYTHDGTLQLVEDTMVYDVEPEEYLLNIRTTYDDFEGNTYTQDHKIYAVKNDGEPEWYPAAELSLNDWVVMPRLKVTEMPDTFVLFWFEKYDDKHRYYTSESLTEINNIRTELTKMNIPNGLTKKGKKYTIFIPLKLDIITTEDYIIRPDYVLKRITSIEKTYEDKVYDITVANNHSYVTTSFAAHNSGAGSLVCYAIGITNLDPLKYQLLFERFLNPERNSLPDLDIDFSSHRRHEVMEYLQSNYGKDHVANIGTYQTMTSKAILKNVGKVMNIDYNLINEWNKQIPAPNGNVMPIVEAREEIELIKEASMKYPELFDLAQSLESMPKSSGVHACGVQIAPNNLLNNLPLWKGKNDEVVTQYEGPELESLGYIKFDVLGVKVLSIIEIASKLAEERNNIKIDINNLEPEDAKVFENIHKGNTYAVFQLSSSGMTNIFKQLNSVNFDSLIAGVSLYRPGPMDHIPDYIARANGEREITYLLPELKEILEPTFGIAIYQESIMKIVQTLGGYSAGEADSFRKAIG